MYQRSPIVTDGRTLASFLAIQLLRADFGTFCWLFWSVIIGALIYCATKHSLLRTFAILDTYGERVLLSVHYVRCNSLHKIIENHLLLGWLNLLFRSLTGKYPDDSFTLPTLIEALDINLL